MVSPQEPAASGPSSSSRPVPRWSLAALALGHACIFAWAASVLPWQRWTAFAAMTAVLALAHTVTAALALAGSRHRALAWRIGSALSLIYLAIQTLIAARAGTYVAALYGGLGKGVFAALAALWAVLVLLTLPFAAWGLAATGGFGKGPGLRRRLTGGLAVLLAFVTFSLWRAAAAAAATPIAAPTDDPAALAAAIQDVLPRVRPRKDADLSLWTRAPITCDYPIDRPTAFVVYPVADRPDDNKKKIKQAAKLRPAARCVQADSAEALLPALAAVVADAGAPGPMKIDIVRGAQPLVDALPGPLPLLFRPGLDGACLGARCLLPWQLLGLNQFLTYTPLPFIEDLRFGAAPAALRKALARKGDPVPEPDVGVDGLTRLDTVSLLVDHRGQVRPLPRLRDAIDHLDADLLARALAGAEAHILAAQAEDGRFRYLLHPFTGKVTWRGFAVPRQAGTTLALCELGSDAAVPAARSSLGMLAGLRKDFPEHGYSVLSYQEGRPPPLGDLGSTALPLIAFLSCRDRTGPEHDELIGALGRYILAMQRPDGGFHARVTLATGDAHVGPDLLYAAGQAVFALVLLEELSARQPSDLLPPHAEVRAAVERAMTYFSEDYWSHGLYGFFFLEENWHCLAARAALGVHRHPGYERFCLDYVDFKRRLIMDESSGVAPELVGSYGFGNVLVPHNTPSAGFGEALAAAMAVRAADGERRPEDTSLMEHVLTFLIEQQWSDANCFACARDQRVTGGWSESVGSLDVRIDYTQHAWAALGHGGRQLGLTPGSGGG
ncbi:hypothetical protein [Nannocystis radixulma]|uniref:Uncharacterized protein n=1 Tax=Nannocystis radixulma TaxID=2995305 RepID=A0ABT5AXP2_9BACT|nr:hypothetical protein [Nannocystis radixulma]MDC0666605.1 hypothetical protein [Nannocystis radixulma]